MPVNNHPVVHFKVVKEFGVQPIQFMLSVIQAPKTKLLSLLMLSSVLIGCSGNSSKAPVVDRSHAAKQRQYNPVTTGQYVVKRGDTLYSIAFRFGWDWKALAARNNIYSPFVIVPGQVIRFSNSGQTAVVAKAPINTKKAPVSARAPVAVAAKKPVAVTQTKPVVAAKPVTPVTTTKQTMAAGQQGKWLWPANGTLVGMFSSNTSLNKGIDIAGQLGQPIVATADGSVVYAGSGLRGYGELVIIKHNDTFISAYGHNRRLLVNEGQVVKAGQQIAEMGSTGTEQVKVHFEIRRQGKPVDPMQYLPKR